LTSFWYQLVILAVVYLVLLPDSLLLKRVIERLRGGHAQPIGQQLT
jgi:lipopolysaccharide export system permease protein